MPQKAFILAAGFGTRMRPLTDLHPKPLLEAGGRSLLNHALDHLQEAGVQEAVINMHHLADQIPAHLKQRHAPLLHFSHEKTLLDTGGGIKNALARFGHEPFYVLSGDGYWLDNPARPALAHLAESWDEEKMDILILLQKVSSMRLTRGIGDYDLDAQGRAIRSLSREGQYMFTSMRINHPRIFENTPEGAFSYLDLLDRAQQKGRLFGIVHAGDWHHLSTPEDLAAVNEALSQMRARA